jgi:hypothetical protein
LGWSDGRECKTVYAGTGAPYRQSFYNDLGQLSKQPDPDGVVKTNLYNFEGELMWSVIDSNRNDEIDWLGPVMMTVR